MVRDIMRGRYVVGYTQTMRVRITAAEMAAPHNASSPLLYFCNV
jgi:hypothetical protein